MNGSRETLTLSQNGESICQVSHVVFMWYILGLNWFMSLNEMNCACLTYLERLGWIKSSNLISRCLLVQSVEHSMEHAWVCSECSSLHKKINILIRFGRINFGRVWLLTKVEASAIVLGLRTLLSILLIIYYCK